MFVMQITLDDFYLYMYKIFVIGILKNLVFLAGIEEYLLINIRNYYKYKCAFMSSLSHLMILYFECEF